MMLALEQDSGFLGFNSKLEKGYELTFKPLLPHYTTQEEEAAAAEEVQVPVPAPATNANPPGGGGRRGRCRPCQRRAATRSVRRPGEGEKRAWWRRLPRGLGRPGTMETGVQINIKIVKLQV